MLRQMEMRMAFQTLRTQLLVNLYVKKYAPLEHRSGGAFQAILLVNTRQAWEYGRDYEMD